MSTEIYKKLVVARENVQTVAKTKTADTGKYTYKYATLGDVMAAADEAFDVAGLQWVQHIAYHEPDKWQLVTVVIDMASGDAVQFGGLVNPVKGDPQAQGSAVSYSRRYALVTLLGMNVEDDDGAQAHRAEVSPNERTEAEKQVRKIVKDLPDAMAREDFQAAFVEAMGSTLTNLPEARHGDALMWAKEWLGKFRAGGSQ